MNDCYSTGRNNNDGQADQLARKKAKILNIAQRKTEMEETQLGNRTHVGNGYTQTSNTLDTDGWTDTKNNNNDTTGFGALEGRESEFVVNRRGGGAGSGVGGIGSGGSDGDDRCLSGGSGAGALASCRHRAARRRSDN